MMVIRRINLYFLIEFLLISNHKLYSDYIFFPDNFTFYDSILKCASINSTVVFIESKTKDDYIYENYVSKSNLIWLSIIGNETNKTTGSVNYYTNKTLNFNNWGTHLSASTPCTVYTNDSFYGPWDDVYCSNNASLLCETNLSTDQINQIISVTTRYQIATTNSVFTSSLSVSATSTLTTSSLNSGIISSLLSISSSTASIKRTSLIAFLSSTTSSVTTQIISTTSRFKLLTHEILNQSNLIVANTSFASWHTVLCIFTRTRYNTLNTSQVESYNVTIANLDLCDKLDGNYNLNQIINIKKKSTIEIEAIQSTLKIKLKEIEVHQIKIQNIISGVLWLAIVVIISFSLIIIACDLHTFFIFLAKKIK